MARLRGEARAVTAALGFLTRVPVAIEIRGEDLRRAGPYFPLVGAAIGGTCAAVNKRAGPELALVAMTVLTGALHLDALCDVADASSTADRERALEIMCDSRIGAFGATALTLDLMLKRAALRSCRPRRMIASCALARTVPVVIAARLPYARADGTGASLAQSGGQRAAATLATGTVCALISARGAGVHMIATATAVGLVSEVAMRRWLGGSTGDTLGTSLELTEMILLAQAGWA